MKTNYFLTDISNIDKTMLNFNRKESCMKKYHLFSFLILVNTSLLGCFWPFCQVNSSKNNPKTHFQILLSPHEKTNGEHNHSFQFLIPPEHKLASQESLYPNALMLEYIPNDQTLETWDEIITINMLPIPPGISKSIGGLQGFAKKLYNNNLSIFNKKDTPNPKFISFSEEGLNFVYYSTITPHTLPAVGYISTSELEMSGHLFFEGKNDFYSICYIIKYPKTASIFEIENIEEKIKNFLNQAYVLRYKTNGQEHYEEEIIIQNLANLAETKM